METKMENRKTRWTDRVGDKPLQEYPRPQFVRESYLNLNGYWDCCFTDAKSVPKIYNQQILVPFPPEAMLSGVGRTLMPEETLWYRKRFTLPKNFLRDRVLLHFGAVDQICKVYVNGKCVGTNIGGYYPFSFDITDQLRDSNEIIIRVRDFSDTKSYETGKQRLRSRGPWYQPQSGIWQTVWLESVPASYIKSVRMTPNLDAETVSFEFDLFGKRMPVEIEIRYRKKQVARTSCEKAVVVKLNEIHPWSPEDPNLYDVLFRFGDDEVKSYFAMRKISVGKAADGQYRIFLNNKAYFCHGLLDQGYWSDGLYTAPTEEAMAFDIVNSKRLGFNTLRKHVKIEPLRWYYLCDKLGMLVFQDMINGGSSYHFWYIMMFQLFQTSIRDDEKHYKGFGRLDQKGREQFYLSLERMVKHLYNSPCIVLWTAFNEGWGQFDARTAYQKLKNMDPGRLVDHASGWHDQGAGDVDSHHRYILPIKVTPDKRGHARPFIMSEFGGYELNVEQPSGQNNFMGHRTYQSVGELNSAVCKLYRESIIGNIPKGLSAAIYTQVSDVETERNGIFTYNRNQIKLREEEMLPLATEIKNLYEKY